MICTRNFFRKIALAVWLSILANFSSASVVAINDKDGKYVLEEYFSYLEDKHRAYDYENLINDELKASLNDESIFVASDIGTTNFGFTQSTYWVKLQLQSDLLKEETLYLELAYPLLDEADLYLQRPDGTSKLIKSGKIHAFSERFIAYHNPIFPIDLTPGKRYTLYFKLRNRGPLQFPMTLLKAEKLVEKVNVETFVLGLFYGLLGVMVLYNLFLYLAIQDRSYLYYVLYVGSYLCLMLSLNGLAYEYLWSDAIWWVSHSVPFFLFFTMVWIIQFARSFLKTRENTPWLNRILIYQGCAAASCTLLLPFIAYRTSLMLACSLIILLSPTLLLTGIRCWRLGNRPALFFLIAWSIFLLGIMARALMSFGIVPLNFFTEYGSHLGAVIEVITLSLGLADRINSERRARNAETIQRKVAEASAKSKSLFLANMSHEMRTPMNAIVGFSNLALEEQDTKQQALYVKKIWSASSSLLAMMDGVLDFSKIEAGKLPLRHQPFHLACIISEMSDIFEPEFKQRKLGFSVSYEPDLPVALLGDGARLKQVLINLVGNALKFTHQGEVTLRIERAEQFPCNTECDAMAKTILRFTVQDTGIGIHQQDVGKLFKPFFQVDSSTTRNYGGSGLGLAISSYLIKSMGGDISVESEAGHGSTFSFTAAFGLPSLPETFMRDDRASGLTHLEGAHILLVEDDQTNQEVATIMLEKLGIKVSIANNGREAIAKVAQSPEFQLVLMDLQMPEMDGYETTRQLRQNPAFGTLPIVAMTAHAIADERENCLQSGMDDFITKPFSPDLLIATLKKWVGPRHQTIQQTHTSSTHTPRKVLEVQACSQTLDPIDFVSGLDRFQGDKNRYQHALLNFQADYESFLTSSEPHQYTDDNRALQAPLHKLIGAAANLGAKSIESQAKQLHEHIDKRANIIQQINMLKTTLADTFSAITHYTAGHAFPLASADKATQDAATSRLQQLIKLHDHLQASESDAEFLFASLKNWLLEIGTRSQVSEIEQNIHDYEFEDARLLLVELMPGIEAGGTQNE